MTMQRIYRHRLLIKIFVVYLIAAHGFQILFPTVAYALTSGPSQPEFNSFEPVSTSQMVDPFTGSFTYNIPLMDVGGYPINLSYHANGGMDAEASYVGYNWNLGIGALNHNIQATPDDFNGDLIERKFNLRPNTTIGLSAGAEFELFGYNAKKSKRGLSLGVKLGVYHNTYNGMGFEFGASPAFNAANKSNGKLTAGLNLGFNSQSGVGASANLSYEVEADKQDAAEKPTGRRLYGRKIGVGGSYNSRGGLQMLSLSAAGSYEHTRIVNIKNKDKGKKEKAKLTSRHKLKASGSLSFASPTHTPQLSFPFTSLNFTFDATIGAGAYGAHPALNFTGYVASQFVPNHKRSISNRAYGYAYLHEAPDEFTSSDPVTLDFSREGDGPFIQNATPSLAVTRPGFDLYSATGQGIAGSFRAFRDPGMVYDPFMRSTSVDASAGIETGGGGLLHIGLNVSGLATFSSSGRWSRIGTANLFANTSTPLAVPDNSLRETFRFKGKEGMPKNYEPFYFKQLGEYSVNTDEDFYNRLGGDKAVRVAMKPHVYGEIDESVKLTDDAGTAYNFADYGRNPAQRAKRNQTFQMLTAEEASLASLNKTIRNYPLNDFTFQYGELKYEDILRTDGDRKAHHFSSPTVTRQDGMRYVYDLPAYNWKQKEVSFNVTGRSSSCSNGLVTYEANDATIENDRGIDHYYQATTTPAYAHSYLLTGVLSPDYVDLTGNGITEDDLGQAFQLNYTRYQDRYQWRTPIGSSTVNQANHNPGYEARTEDDKANYTYGEKEIWYIHSIVSRHYIAEFTYQEDRRDSYGVDDENGGVDIVSNQNLLRLEKISLYSKKERMDNPTGSVPIKTVHFDTSYELFSGANDSGGTGVPNSPSQSGKLTLNKIWFTHRNSNRGQYTPYRFFYGDPDHDKQTNADYNPGYSQRAYDRWGNYQPNLCTLPNYIYPFTNQDPVAADKNAQMWLLHTIQTPSGGTINIDYEAHRYAYVQDRKAMQMFEVYGIGEDRNTLTQNNFLFKKLGHQDFKNYNILFVKLPQTGLNDADFQRRYLTGADGKWMKEMYFNFRLPIDKFKDGVTRTFEQVEGFVRIKDGGLVPGNADYGWIEIEEYGLKKADDTEKSQGIARSAWNFIRLNLPEFLFPGSNPNQSGEAAIKALGGFFMEMKAMFTGYRAIMRNRLFADRAILDRSWIRLHTPYGNKIGGQGARVKQIFTSDEWATMTNSNAPSNTYGQQYDYTTTDPKTGETISSGVAAFEPLLGMSENPFYEPDRFEKEKIWAENDEMFSLKPKALFAFPAATVGYSKIKISNLSKNDATTTVTRHGMGHTIKEFYTAKQFPTLIKQTELDGAGAKKLRLLKRFHYARFSQGYLIKRNDMHGKPYREMAYAENGTEPLSGVTYLYRTQATFDEHGSNELNNEGIEVIDPDGTLRTARIGHEMEFMLDERQQQTRSMGVATGGNLEAFLLAIFPAAVPTIHFTPSYSHTRARFMVATKVIDQYGLMDETIAFDGNARVSTQNVAYDAETGGVLLTRTTNEFKDPIYNFTYPAHWLYDEMGPAYKNVGMEWRNESLSGIPTPEAAQLVRGDELLLVADGNNTTDTEMGWVLDNGSALFVVRQDGTQIDPADQYAQIKVIRSGRRNLQTTPLGSVVSMADPRTANPNGGLQEINRDAKIVTTSGQVFSDRWQTQCGVPDVEQYCECEELTTAAQELETLLGALAQNGELIGTPVDLNPYFTNLSLPAALGADLSCLIEWVPIPTASNSANCTQALNAEIRQTCPGNAPVTLANLTLAVAPNQPYTLCLEYVNSFDGIAAVIADPNVCQDEPGFSINATLEYCPGGTSDIMPMTGSIDAFPIRDCDYLPLTLFACNEPNEVVNPYWKGIRGNWRPVRSYTYLTGRTNINADNRPTPLMATQIQQDGIYTAYSPLFHYQNGKWEVDATDWVFTAETTRYIPQGQAVESRDPLGRYSAAIFGYQAQVPIAVAANARNVEIANANFEVAKDVGINCQAPVKFENTTETDLVATYAHTGQQSLKIAANLAQNSPTLIAELSDAPLCDPNVADAKPYLLQECDCAGNFQPLLGEEYLLTFWLHGDAYHDLTTPINDYAAFGLEIEVGGTPVSQGTLQKGILLDGWQRYEVRFTLPGPGANGPLEIRFRNDNALQPLNNLYVDDVRVQPFNSSMSTYVYRSDDLRLMATLDEHGYASFYQYDKAGNLIGTLQETERGIQSLQEARNYIKPDLTN